MEQDLQEMSVLRDFERDSEWFHKNVNKLREDGFEGKFVAVKNSKTFASDKNVDLLINEIEKKGENPSYVFIEFVHPEGFTLIL